MGQTDIPPGGEGKIEVTFKTGRRKGRQRKEVKVTSNDPVNQTVTLSIIALVEVEFDFEPHLVDMGKIKKGDTAVSRASILIENPEKTKLVDISTSSSLVTARIVEDEPSKSDPHRIEVEVTVLPGPKPGRINETVTAHFNEISQLTATLKITGEITGDVEVTPEILYFNLYRARGVSDQDAQRVKIINKSANRKLHILGVKDPGDRLNLDLTTVEDGVRFVLTAKPKPEVLERDGRVGGSIIIWTDNPEENEIKLRYSLVIRK